MRAILIPTPPFSIGPGERGGEAPGGPPRRRGPAVDGGGPHPEGPEAWGKAPSPFTRGNPGGPQKERKAPERRAKAPETSWPFSRLSKPAPDGPPLGRRPFLHPGASTKTKAQCWGKMPRVPQGSPQKGSPFLFGKKPRGKRIAQNAFTHSHGPENRPLFSRLGLAYPPKPIIEGSGGVNGRRTFPVRDFEPAKPSSPMGGDPPQVIEGPAPVPKPPPVPRGGHGPQWSARYFIPDFNNWKKRGLLGVGKGGQGVPPLATPGF